MEKLLNDIKAKVEEFIKDADLQAEKGNKAAGMRAAKHRSNWRRCSRNSARYPSRLRNKYCRATDDKRRS